ncbi:MAG TPA: hypothetical protein VF897_19065, partial [Roseiflexaceae bacterium]
MTANELLVLLGRAWSPLLLYPGGLSALALVWLIAAIGPRQGARGEGMTARRSPLAARRSPSLEMIAVVLPWLGLALLPLPLATGLSRQIDLIAVLALLEWPRVLAIARDLGGASAHERADGMRQLAAALNSLPPLILATLALAQASGSFEIGALARAPGELVPATARALHWLGALAWSLTLLPALGIGPFATTAPEILPRRHGEHGERRWPGPALLQALRGSVAWVCGAGALPIGLRLRALGLIWLAALPWMAALGALDEGSSGVRLIAG